MSNLNSILTQIISLQQKTIKKIDNSGGQTIPSNVTTQGNIFNGPDQLVKTDETGKIPSTLIDNNSYSKAEIDAKFEELYDLWEKEY